MASSSSSSPTQQWRYDVFLSFRGEDTRKAFNDHLYTCLTESGILTFRDNEELQQGECIAPNLFEAIEKSWCSVIVLSKKYAFSRWCLDELVHILKQKKHKVFPVFYDVDPSDIRKQTGSLQEAFAKHETIFDQARTQRWRDALSQVADLKGWHLNDRYESEFIKEIVRKISTELYQTYSSVCNDLIGIDSRLVELRDKLCFREDDVRIVGICGMGGIGKTTLARVVFEHMSSYFEGKCFLDAVREASKNSELVSLQKLFLSKIFPKEKFKLSGVTDGTTTISNRLRRKRVLVVIDDADNKQQLECLAGKRDWFGLGSRIIITTRDEHLLRAQGVDDVYKPATLDASESLQLLSLKAFKSIKPENNFTSLSQSVVKYAGGLPLALEVLGSFLCGRDASQWRSAIESLESEPNKEIINCLQISFDGLSEAQRKIFLDIAHFFKGLDKDFVTKILDGCGYNPGIGLCVLIERSLITVEHNIIGMHDLLQEMGRNIVRQKSLDEPGKRCRLVEESDVYQVLTENSATEAIEGILINSIKRDGDETLTLSADAFSKMSKLRLLIVRSHLKSCDLKYLSKELRLFNWPGYPLKSLPCNFLLDKLVALVLPDSCIQQLWKGDTCLNNLKIVDLKGSRNLISTPDFTKAPNLESLNLEGCTNLVDVNPSIAFLKELNFLNLRNCKCLTSLPTEIGMESLETLILSGCSSVRRFPEIIGKMTCLRDVYLDGTSIEELPSSIGNCSSIKFLDISGSRELENSPSSFLSSIYRMGCRVRSSLIPMLLMKGSSSSMALTLTRLSSLTSLRELNISGRNLCEGTLPSEICGLISLVTLVASHNNFVSLPTNLCHLTNLYSLQLEGCKSLKSLPKLPPSIYEVEIGGCVSLERVPIPTKAYASLEPGLRLITGLPNYSGVNCYKLAANRNGLRMLKAHLKLATKGRNFDIVLPGSEISEWFTHQSEECEVNEGSEEFEETEVVKGSEECEEVIMPSSSTMWIPLPPDLLDDSDWMGLAFCFIFTPDTGAFAWGLSQPNSDKWMQVYFSQLQGESYQESGDHLWHGYVSSEEVKHWVELNPLFLCDALFISIWSNGHPVKKTGARLVYRSDIEDMELTVEQPTPPTSPILEKSIHTNQICMLE